MTSSATFPKGWTLEPGGVSTKLRVLTERRGAYDSQGRSSGVPLPLCQPRLLLFSNTLPLTP